MTLSSNADKPRSFSEIQYDFTGHIRDPENQPAPADIEDRRMEIYRGLLYRNVESFIAKSYPVLRKITPDERWHGMIRHYFKNHQAHTPLFPKMPQEFLRYLENERGEQPGDFPFLKELAHYEWVELGLALDSRDIDMEGIDVKGDLLEGVPQLNPLVWPLCYRFPVHRIGPEYLPEAAPEQPTYLMVYRDNNDKVGFMEMNPVAARLVELLQAKTGASGKELLANIAGELNHPDPDVVINGGKAIMEEMRNRDIILGTVER